MHCKECRDPLYQILLCNLSPISTMWKTFNATMQKIILFTETVWKLYFSNCEKQYFNMKTECDLIVQRAQLNTREEFLAWKQRCDNFIESLEKQMLNDYRLMLNNRWSLVSRDSKIWKILCANVLCKWMPDIMQDFDGMRLIQHSKVLYWCRNKVWTHRTSPIPRRCERVLQACGMYAKYCNIQKHDNIKINI